MTELPSSRGAAPSTQTLNDLTDCARFLLQRPFLCQEYDPDRFRLVRRYEQALDRWFTQRLGYRLHVTADAARLYKSTSVAFRRPLVTASKQPRPLATREYTLVCLILAAVAAGPRVISLRDLIDRIRAAANDADVVLAEEPSERRALVTAVQWLIANGVARELHERVEHYISDEQADAVLEVEPDRVALLPLRRLASADSAAELLDRPERLTANRQWMRARLVEDGVLYRDDLLPAEWLELRRRLGEEADILGEMFELQLEARAEGVATIDPHGVLTDQPMPAGGTVGHAALLLLERLCDGDEAEPVVPMADVVETLGELASGNSHWSKLADEPSKLASRVLVLLADHRLVEVEGDVVRVRPLAHRFKVADEPDGTATADAAAGPTGPGVDGGSGGQGQLW